MVITCSRDRDHEWRGARLTVRIWGGNRTAVKGWLPGQGRNGAVAPSLFLVFLGLFFGSTRAASILPSRPPDLSAGARRGLSRSAVGLVLRHTLLFPGRALTGPSTAACLIGRGQQGAATRNDGARPRAHHAAASGERERGGIAGISSFSFRRRAGADFRP
jgi:hypothetical protein